MNDALTFSPLSPAHLEPLLALQERIFADLDDVTLLRRNSPEMLLSCLREPHFSLGAWHRDTLAAIAVLYVPQDVDEDLAHLLLDVDLPAAAANYKLCMVDTPYRGRGLQRQMGASLEDVAHQRGFRMLCATASPLNGPSCHNLLSQGFVFNRRLEKYGFDRNLFYKLL